MKSTHPLARLHYHVSGAIERGEAKPIAGIPSVRSELAIAADLLMGVACQPADELPGVLRERMRAVALSAYAALARAKGVQGEH
jgi:hypothetical protein